MITQLQAHVKPLLKLFGFKFEKRKISDHEIVLWRSPQLGARQNNRLVIVPGFGDTPLSWMPVVFNLLALMKSKPKTNHQFSEIVLIELPGYIGSLYSPGYSPGYAPDPAESKKPLPVRRKKKAPKTLEQLASITNELVNELQPVTLVGHSMGGFLAANYCINFPRTSIKQLILLCPSGMIQSQKEQKRTEEILKKAAEGTGGPFIELAIGPKSKNPSSWVRHKIVAREFEEFLSRDESRSILMSFKKEHEMNQRAKLIQVPVRLIWGEDDQLIRIESFKLWRKALAPRANSKLEATKIKKATHSIQLEAPRQIAEIIGKL